MTAAEVVERLDAKKSGDSWIAVCPAHDDHDPSLSISEGKDGRVLLKCFAGCQFDAILSARAVFFTGCHN
jgi:DNA primase